MHLNTDRHVYVPSLVSGSADLSLPQQTFACFSPRDIRDRQNTSEEDRDIRETDRQNTNEEEKDRDIKGRQAEHLGRLRLRDRQTQHS